MEHAVTLANRHVVLVEYFCTDDVTLVFGARAGWAEPRVEEIPKSLDEIRRFVVQTFGPPAASLRAPASMHQRVQSVYNDDWQEFAAAFVNPIRAWANEGDLLWLVPHDVLHYVPLHALNLDGNPLIARHPVVYTPSASVMKYCRAKRTDRRRERAVVLGDAQHDLAFAQEEALMVAERFKTHAMVDHQATKSALKAELSPETTRVDVVHLACHGYFNTDQPLKSGIMLAPTGEADASLTAEEIFGLELNADLVVLSACESGVNDRKPGDELIGLTRALIYAGTPSVVVSLWPVDDLSTLILMDRFYDELAHDLNKAEALQAAQCHVMTLDEAAVHTYIRARAEKLKRSGFVDRAHHLEQLAYDSLLEAQDYNPRPTGGAPWRPFSLPVCWAPFILVGDWN